MSKRSLDNMVGADRCVCPFLYPEPLAVNNENNGFLADTACRVPTSRTPVGVGSARPMKTPTVAFLELPTLRLPLFAKEGQFFPHV
jgi:hypothetical protein